MDVRRSSLEDDEALRDLELLRRRLEEVRASAGSLGDYLDRGHAPASEEESLHEQLGAADAEAQALERELRAKVKGLRKGRPEVVRRWAETHVEVYREVESGAGGDRLVLHVAREAIEGWGAVVEGSRALFDENPYVMAGRRSALERRFGF